MKDLRKIKLKKRKSRQSRIRAKIFGTEKKPRLSVTRSKKHISAQIIDDNTGRTVIYVSDSFLEKKEVGKRKRVVVVPPKDSGDRKAKVAVAFELGKILANKAKEKGIESVVFDRRGFKYHGRVKAVAEGAREGGLKF